MSCFVWDGEAAWDMELSALKLGQVKASQKGWTSQMEPEFEPVESVSKAHMPNHASTVP